MYMQHVPLPDDDIHDVLTAGEAEDRVCDHARHKSGGVVDRCCLQLSNTCFPITPSQAALSQLTLELKSPRMMSLSALGTVVIKAFKSS